MSAISSKRCACLWANPCGHLTTAKMRALMAWSSDLRMSRGFWQLSVMARRVLVRRHRVHFIVHRMLDWQIEVQDAPPLVQIYRYMWRQTNELLLSQPDDTDCRRQ